MQRKSKKYGPYSKGDLNKAIDLLLHPLISNYPQLLSVDGLLHGLVEGNVKESIQKFLRYNMNTLAEEFWKWLESQSK